MYEKIEDAQRYLYHELEARNIHPENDPFKSGFIGLNDSITTTTKGSLTSKQCSTDPLWGVQFLRWFDELGIKSGDKVFLSVSSSFPGLDYSCIAACEMRGLNPVLCVSLGASSWGANRPDMNMADILDVLRAGGYMNIQPEFWTLGGLNENADNMNPKGREILISSMKGRNLEIRSTLQEIVALKAQHIPGSKLVINIGGNASFMGYGDNFADIPSGVIMPGDNIDFGNGLAGIALKAGIPFINIRSLKGLAEKCGINYSIASEKIRG